jgi:DNA-binding MarR family transcriptional regulator
MTIAQHRDIWRMNKGLPVAVSDEGSTPRTRGHRGRSLLAKSPEEPWDAFREAFWGLRTSLADVVERFDLLLSEYRALALCAGRPATATELSRALGVTSGGVTELLDRLERRGFTYRDSHPQDRRAILVRLTSDGRRAYREARAAYRKFLGELQRRMTPEDREAFARGIRALRAALEADRR